MSRVREPDLFIHAGSMFNLEITGIKLSGKSMKHFSILICLIKAVFYKQIFRNLRRGDFNKLMTLTIPMT